MKTIVLRDIHGRRVWMDVVNTQTFDKVVFLGDYVDSFDVSSKDQLENLMDIVAFKKSCPEKVILLIGNHDYHYFPEVGDTGTSGYRANMAPSFGDVFDQNRNLFQMAYKEGTCLFTHAGFAPTWLERHWKEEWQVERIDERINDLWRYKPISFAFAHFDGRSNPYGDDVW
ncbi:MAG: hypothetical protein EOO10_09195 [Chitinophagaceae bacterium]|nr:MAG: hypothetical protein EOO10_09195 [Chitinophagaceae bacterium]